MFLGGHATVRGNSFGGGGLRCICEYAYGRERLASARPNTLGLLQITLALLSDYWST